MGYNITVVKDILLKLKAAPENQTVSLKDFPENKHKEISENIQQLGKENFISGTFYSSEKTLNDAYDFNIYGLKKNLRGLQLLELLQKEPLMEFFIKYSSKEPQITIADIINKLKNIQIKVGIL